MAPKRISKRKLEKLDEEESQRVEDRFSSAERRVLLDAYNIHGFQVFQDFKLLQQYFPNRRESDLKELIKRLRSTHCVGSQSSSLDGWQKLCQQMMGNFAKDRKVNLDDALAHALLTLAEEKEIESKQVDSESSDIKPDYPLLLRSFAQLLMGNFPDKMSPINAQISMNLFNHINRVVDSFDLKALASLEGGTWLEESIHHRRQRQEMALKGLNELDGAPTLRAIEKNRNIEALCLELPKIKRITDVLNPLLIDESMLRDLQNTNQKDTASEITTTMS